MDMENPSSMLYILWNLIRGTVRYYFLRTKQPFTRLNCEALECDTWELGQFVYRKLIRTVGVRPFPPHELMLMSAAMLWWRPKIIVEWGTNVGASARGFHEVNIRYGIGAEIHSVDLPDFVAHAEHAQHRRGILVRGLPVFLHQGDGATMAVSVLCKKSCYDPLIFIDGDHSRENVLRDARTILEAAPGASLLFHDTFCQPGSTYNHGPHEAVMEILREKKGVYQVVDAGLGCPGMTLLIPCIAHEIER